MGVIRRSFIYLDTETFTRLYKVIVRPHLEYTNSVWMSRRKKDIITLENVQRRQPSWFQVYEIDLSYPNRLKQFNLPTLVYRRLRGDMIKMFKMVSGAYDKQVMPAIVTAEEGFYQTRRHNSKLPRKQNKTWLKQHYFRERIK